LQKKATGLPKKIAEKVARGLGYHPQALTLAAGTLAIRKDEGYKVTAKKLLKRAKKGKGFGNLPFLDEADKITAVEVALKFSYDYLGEQGSNSRQFQQRFRALGIFAQEAEFSTVAAAAVWELTEKKAEKYMRLLHLLSLANKVVVDDGMKKHIRWQQHAILRAYELSLQEHTTEDPQMQWRMRHVEHCLKDAESCFTSKPRDNNRLEQELKQINHAFTWCKANSPEHTVKFALYMNGFFAVRGRIATQQKWLNSALTAAKDTEDKQYEANVLKSLGDLELRSGNMNVALQHFNNKALALFKAERDVLGRANVLRSLGDLEFRLGNVRAARQHFENVLPLYQKVWAKTRMDENRI
jgi:tetratricopeptide (TPR) repeat protein